MTCVPYVCMLERGGGCCPFKLNLVMITDDEVNLI